MLFSSSIGSVNFLETIVTIIEAINIVNPAIINKKLFDILTLSCIEFNGIRMYKKYPFSSFPDNIIYDSPFLESLCFFIVKLSFDSNSFPPCTLSNMSFILPITVEKFLFVVYKLIPLLSFIKMSKLFFIDSFSSSVCKSLSCPGVL